MKSLPVPHINIMNSAKVLQTKPGEHRIPYLVALHIVAIASMATGLSVLWEWGGVCVDVLKCVIFT